MTNLQRVKYIHKLLSLNNFRTAREINAALHANDIPFTDENIKAIELSVLLW